MARSTAHNQAFADSLKAKMTGYAKLIQSEIVAIALDNAIWNTVKDSGRAAANWNLSFGTGAVPDQLNPSKYNQTGQSYGTIGKRNSRVDGESIRDAKGSHYGYRKDEGTIDKGYIHTVQGLDGVLGWSIRQMIGVGRAGAVKTVFLYNPVIQVDNYAYNAKLEADYLAGPTPLSEAQTRADQVMNRNT